MTLNIPPKFKYFYSAFKNKEFNLLDIGAGNHSATKTKALFKQCNYYGVDRANYLNDEKDFALMKKFYEMDLTLLKFDSIPDNYFDVIMMTHVIEHLHNGDKVIEGLISKLKAGGYIYVEFPGERSKHLPSMKGTLNFYDDPTHVRLFSVPEVENVLKQKSFQILKSGTRRHWPYIILLPLNMVKQRMKYGYVPGGTFWDLMGFAEFVFAQKIA